MIDKQLERLKFQTTTHHKQNLRAQINPKMIDELEISHIPSTNYKNAFKNLYNDQLQKSLNLHENKKNIEKIKDMYDTKINHSHYNTYNNSLKNSTLGSTVHNLNYRDVEYRDYDLEKQTRALQHTLSNMNGPAGFYKEDQKHKMNSMSQQQKMKLELSNQLKLKQLEKYNEMIRKRSEQLAMREQENRNYLSDKEKLDLLKKNKQDFRGNIIEQIQDAKVRRGRRSLFHYDNLQRHNPITNPIEYHIDNPYILKQIQNQKFSQ